MSNKGKKPDHKTKPGKREIPASICVQPGCKFFGKFAQQGVCYSRLDKISDAYIKSLFAHGEGALEGWRSLRKANKLTTTAKWAKFLEQQFVAAWANVHSSLDELVYHRGEIAKLRAHVRK